MENYLFDNCEDMYKGFNDFVKKVKLKHKDRSGYIIKHRGIGIFTNNKTPINTDIEFMGICPYIKRLYGCSLCGVHTSVWILHNLYGEFLKEGVDYYTQRIEEIYYAELLSSLEPNGKIFNFSLKRDYEELKSKHKLFSHNFVFDVLAKEHRKYQDVDYIVEI